MKHGPLNMDFTVYGPDAERMQLGQRWPVRINESISVGEVISVRKVDGLGLAATLRVETAFEVGSFAEATGSVVWDDTVGS